MIKKALAAIFLLILVASCTSKEKEQAMKEVPKETASAVKPAAKTKIVANNFSNKNYKAGVLTKKGHTNEFYFLIDPTVPNPVTVGTKLVFAKTGAANVTKVLTANQGGRIAVFVAVDHDLDPAGDGFPNPILVQ